MSTKTLASMLLLLPAALGATSEVSKSTYVGQEARTIKALSTTDIDALLTGQGMGFAKAAELNGYPGPAHVLELADQLDMTAVQLTQTRAIEASMRAKSRAIGADLVDAERKLDALFASKQVTAQSLNQSLARIGDLQSGLRQAHLEAHLAQASLLNAHQTARYLKLRGYADPQSHEHGAHELHPRN